MDINYIKRVMKERKITQLQLSEITGVPLQTLKYIFTGRTQFPRIDTVQAIEKALGINVSQIPEFSAEEKELFDLIKSMTIDEVKELSNYVDYIISKRK